MPWEGQLLLAAFIIGWRCVAVVLLVMKIMIIRIMRRFNLIVNLYSRVLLGFWHFFGRNLVGFLWCVSRVMEGCPEAG